MERVRQFFGVRARRRRRTSAPRPRALDRVSRVFVTGGSGFIGGALGARLRRARRRGARARPLAEAAAGRWSARGAEPVDGHVLDEDRLARGDGGLRGRLPRRRRSTPTARTTRTSCCASTSAAPRRWCGPPRARASRASSTLVAASVGEAHGHGRARGHAAPRLLPVGLRPLQARGRAGRVRRRAPRLGVEVVAVNPSSVQGPGRSSGNGKIIIAYLNGRLPAFVDVPVSVVDIADVAEAHLLAAERGAAGERYVLNGATIPSREALEIVAELSGRARPCPDRPARRSRARSPALAEGVARVRGRTTSLCRARVGTILHGHRYDGSLGDARARPRLHAGRRTTFARTIDWAVAEGLVTRAAGPRRLTYGQRDPEVARAGCGLDARAAVELAQDVAHVHVDRAPGSGTRSRAISRFVRPTATSRSTSSSRRESPPPPASASARGPSRSATDSPSRATSPAACAASGRAPDPAGSAVSLAHALERELALADGRERGTSTQLRSARARTGGRG